MTNATSPQHDKFQGFFFFFFFETNQKQYWQKPRGKCLYSSEYMNDFKTHTDQISGFDAKSNDTYKPIFWIASLNVNKMRKFRERNKFIMLDLCRNKVQGGQHSTVEM